MKVGMLGKNVGESTLQVLQARSREAESLSRAGRPGQRDVPHYGAANNQDGGKGVNRGWGDEGGDEGGKGSNGQANGQGLGQWVLGGLL